MELVVSRLLFRASNVETPVLLESMCLILFMVSEKSNALAKCQDYPMRKFYAAPEIDRYKLKYQLYDISRNSARCALANA